MADLSRLRQQQRRRGTLGAPPPPGEASGNLAAPETAPAAAMPAGASAVPLVAAASGPGRIDGRTLRRTERTVQLATRVTAAFDARLREIAQRERRLLVEVLERALEAYERQG